VVVLFTTNPVAFDTDGVDAILHAHYPQLCAHRIEGSRRESWRRVALVPSLACLCRWAGTAIAQVLSGVVSPAGRMPYSWVASLQDSGDLGDYKMAGTSKTYACPQPRVERGQCAELQRSGPQIPI
jgi:hypothetical protein